MIPVSITKIADPNDKKLAVEVHKEMLGYMGDKSAPYPNRYAQDILQKAVSHRSIRDEIYVQLIKQLTNNPRPDSIVRGWHLLCMCVGIFPPVDFQLYLLHFLVERKEKGKGAVVDYAKFCLRALQSCMTRGDSTGFIPTVEEIAAYSARPPIVASIYMLDGSFVAEDLPMTPDLNVGTLLEMCKGWLNIKDPRFDTIGIFVEDLGDMDGVVIDEATRDAPYRKLPRTARPLRNEDFIGDIYVQVL